MVVGWDVVDGGVRPVGDLTMEQALAVVVLMAVVVVLKWLVVGVG